MAEGKHLPGGGRILLTGVTGQVGSDLREVLSPLGEVIAPDRAQMDMLQVDSIRSVIRRVQPRWIVNAAAYTAVDRAEREPEAAFAVNAEAVRTIATEALDLGAAVVHFSTDYVFDGSAIEPYRETDATGPVSVYGRSKLAGEAALAETGAAHLIFRTSWVFGAHGKNFLLTILKLARERDHLRVVADQHGAPTWSRDLAHLTAHAIQTFESAADGGPLDAAVRRDGGIYHASGAGETTWHGFATEALRLAALRDPEARFAEVEGIPTSEYATPARRPLNSRLNCSRLNQRLGWSMMDWRHSLVQVVNDL